MHRGSYNVYSPVKTNASNDASDSTFWKTFLCSVIILGVFALILLLIALPLKDDSETFDIDIRSSSKQIQEINVLNNTKSTTQLYDVPEEYDPRSHDRNEVERIYNDKVVINKTHQKLIELIKYTSETEFDGKSTLDDVTEKGQLYLFTTADNEHTKNSVSSTEYPNTVIVTEIISAKQNEIGVTNGSVDVTDTYNVNEIITTDDSVNVTKTHYYLPENGVTDNSVDVTDENLTNVVTNTTQTNHQYELIVNKNDGITTHSYSDALTGETTVADTVIWNSELPMVENGDYTNVYIDKSVTDVSSTERIETNITENLHITQNEDNHTIDKSQNDNIVFFDDDDKQNMNSTATEFGENWNKIYTSTEQSDSTVLSSVIHNTAVDEMITKTEYETKNQIITTTPSEYNYTINNSRLIEITTTPPNYNVINNRREEADKLLVECKKETFEEKEFCDSEECKRISSKMLSLNSFSENPCINYYNYACEGITQDYVQESDHLKDIHQRIQVKLDAINDSSKNYLKMYKNYYESCMNYQVTDGIQKVKKVFNDFGYKFYEEKTELDKIPPLEDLLLKLLERNFAALFDIKVEAESEMESSFSLSLEPVFYEDVVNDAIGDYKIYEKSCIKEAMHSMDQSNETSNTFYSIYKACSERLFIADVRRALLTLDVFVNSTVRSTQLQHLLFDFEQLMMKHPVDMNVAERKRIRADKTNEFLSLSYINLQINHINWTHISKNFVNDEKIQIDSKTKVRVYHLNYLKEMLLAMDTSGTRVDQRRKQHNSILALYAYKLYKDYVLTQSGICDRREYCISLSTKLMNDVSSSLYIKTFDKRQMDALNTYARSTFYEISSAINKYLNSDINIPWKAFKNGAIPQKLDLLTVKKNTPWVSEGELEKRFANVNISCVDFVENTIKLEERYRKLMYATLGESPLLPNNLWTVISSPMDTKPTHYWFDDKAYIVLPLASIPTRKVISKIPAYITMSDLGYKLAKEIIYYFLTPQDKTNVMHNFNTNVFFQFPASNNHQDAEVAFNTKYSARDLLSSVYGAQHAYESYLESRYQNSLHNHTLIWQSSSAEKIFFLHLAQQYCSEESVLENPLSVIENEWLPPVFTVNSIVGNNNEFNSLYMCTDPHSMVGGINITEAQSSYQPKPQAEG